MEWMEPEGRREMESGEIRDDWLYIIRWSFWKYCAQILTPPIYIPQEGLKSRNWSAIGSLLIALKECS